MKKKNVTILLAMIFMLISATTVFADEMDYSPIEAPQYYHIFGPLAVASFENHFNDWNMPRYTNISLESGTAHFHNISGSPLAEYQILRFSDSIEEHSITFYRKLYSWDGDNHWKMIINDSAAMTVYPLHESTKPIPIDINNPFNKIIINLSSMDFGLFNISFDPETFVEVFDPNYSFPLSLSFADKVVSDSGIYEIAIAGHYSIIEAREGNYMINPRFLESIDHTPQNGRFIAAIHDKAAGTHEINEDPSITKFQVNIRGEQVVNILIEGEITGNTYDTFTAIITPHEGYPTWP